MASFYITVRREDGMEPKTTKTPLVEGVLTPVGPLSSGSTRWRFQQRRDAVLFDVAWLRCQGSLRERLAGVRMAGLEQARQAFRSRLDEVCAPYEARYASAEAN